jgi:hypothetical protein
MHGSSSPNDFRERLMDLIGPRRRSLKALTFLHLLRARNIAAQYWWQAKSLLPPT